MFRSSWRMEVTLVVIAVLLGIAVLRPYFKPDVRVLAESGRFDYVHVVSPMFLYQGNQGVLLLDKRNGNVWFIAKGNGANVSFGDPVFIVRIPLEKLDQAPR